MWLATAVHELYDINSIEYLARDGLTLVETYRQKSESRAATVFERTDDHAIEKGIHLQSRVKG